MTGKEGEEVKQSPAERKAITVEYNREEMLVEERHRQNKGRSAQYCAMFLQSYEEHSTFFDDQFSLLLFMRISYEKKDSKTHHYHNY